MLRMYSLALIGVFTLSALAQNVTPAADKLIKQAERAYQAKHFTESASLYTRALSLIEESDRAGVEYNLACSQALAGDSAAAFETLNLAVVDGYIDRKDTEIDKDLVALHTDPRWQPVLERMTLVTAQQNASWGSAAFATPYAPNVADAEKLAGLSELWAQAKFGFANFWHVPQLNWDQTYRDFIPKVLATRSTADYYRVLENFYAQLEDGHSGVYPPDELNISPMPLRTRLVEGHLLILGTSRTDFNLQGLHPGDEIVSIDNEPAIPWAQRHVQPFVSASTPQDRENRTYGSNLFDAPEGTSFHVTTSTPAGIHASHTLSVPPYVASSEPPFELRVFPGNMIYIALNSFEDDTASKEWDKHWPEIRRANSLIVDMRENGGGDQSVGNHILATLLDKTTQSELSRSTRWIATYRAWGRIETPVRFPVDTIEPDPAHQFSGKVVMLIGPKTFSAGEDMAAVFVQAHRGKIIGEPTGGSTGQPLTFKLPGGGAARICTKHDSFADGSEFVGLGIHPDIPAHQTRADIIAGRDSVLDTAIRSLQNKP